MKLLLMTLLSLSSFSAMADNFILQCVDPIDGRNSLKMDIKELRSSPGMYNYEAAIVVGDFSINFGNKEYLYSYKDIFFRIETHNDIYLINIPRMIYSTRDSFLSGTIESFYVAKRDIKCIATSY